MAASIGDEINAATRSYHTTLNQLILQCLPLSLPPHTSGSQPYALGISHFHPIYAAFESYFRTYIGPDASSSQTNETLCSLHIPELERAGALENDISLLLPSFHRVPNPNNHPRLEAFKHHIQASLTHKPHLLFAYTWIFYMALFSGGRYIRSKLRAGFIFPGTSTSQRRLDELAGLSFWNFPGDADGEDLKVDFKARVAALSNDLTEEEKAEIVAEGVYIMISLTDMVREVAETVPAQAVTLAEQRFTDKMAELKGPVARIRPPWILLLRYIFPMGFMDSLSAAIGMAVSRAPEHGAVASLPMQVVAK
ncbi:MAG: hypothetical protein Q9166_003467 [cf. Caloplaca sp. 2 TL-2023]